MIGLLNAGLSNNLTTPTELTGQWKGSIKGDYIFENIQCVHVLEANVTTTAAMNLIYIDAKIKSKDPSSLKWAGSSSC